MSRETFKKVLGNSKVVIGMVHLKPLPGSPAYGGSFAEIYESAREDLARLEAGGMTAAIVENFGDIPYQTNTDDMTVSAMAILIDRLQKESKIPLGINVQYNCTDAEWDLAYLTGCPFIRVEAFVENRLGTHGITWASAPALMRRKGRFPADTLIFADINVKHTFPLVEQPMSFTIHEAIDAGADALIVTGMKTGSAPSMEDLKEMRALAGDLPVLIGSGINASNLRESMAYADGAIIGSSIKENGKVLSPVDTDRVRELIAAL
ncbi:MAG: BtpA/SgcQ family protein [Clostridia bacterium]